MHQSTPKWLSLSVYILLLFTGFSGQMYSQTDTVWYNALAVETSKENAHFYEFKEGKQMVDGKVVLNASQYYLNGQYRKEYLTKNTAISFNFRTLKVKHYNLKGEYRTTISTVVGNLKEIEQIYLDNNNKELGRSFHKNNRFVSGKQLVYYPDDYLTVKEIIESDSDTLTTRVIYYKDGNMASKEVQNTKEKYKVFYDKNKEIIGKLYFDPEHTRSVHHGKKITFNFNKSSVSEYSIYKDGKEIEYRYYEDKARNQLGIKRLKNNKSSKIYYFSNGVIIDSLVNNAGVKNGRQYINWPYEVKDYKDNMVIYDVKHFDGKTSQIKSEQKDGVIIYYDRKGHVLGQLSVDRSGNPIDGDQFRWKYNGRLDHHTTYKNGKEIEYKTFAYHPITGKRYVQERRFGMQNTVYFSNGKIKNTNKNVADRSTYTYYSYKGDSLPVFSLGRPNQLFTYDFFEPPFEHILKSKEIRNKENDLISRKAWYKPSEINIESDSSRLFYEYKANGNNTIYDENGVLIVKLYRSRGKITLNDHHIFKVIINNSKAQTIDISIDNGIIYSECVTISDPQKSGTYIQSFVDVRDGPFTNYYNNSNQIKTSGTYLHKKRSGVFKTYYKNGRLETESIYVSGRKHGKQIFYDEQGGASYELLYKSGYPYSGFIPNKETGLLDVCHSGIYINSISLLEYASLNKEKLFKSSVLELVNVNTKKKYARFEMENEVVEGSIDYYNNKGKSIYKGTYKEGILVNGHTFFEIYKNIGDQDRIQYRKDLDNYLLVHLTIKDNLYIASFYNQNLKLTNTVKSITYLDVLEEIKRISKQEEVYNKDTRIYEYSEFRNLALSSFSIDVITNTNNKTYFK